MFISDVNKMYFCFYLYDTISEHAENFGYGVVERFVGHGVGTIFHSEPVIMHHRKYFHSFMSLVLYIIL